MLDAALQFSPPIQVMIVIANNGYPDQTSISNFVTVAKNAAYTNIIAATCGSEMWAKAFYGMGQIVATATQWTYGNLSSCINQLKYQSGIPSSILIGSHETVEPYWYYNSGNPITPLGSTNGFYSLPLDFLGVDIYPFYANAGSAKSTGQCLSDPSVPLSGANGLTNSAIWTLEQYSYVVSSVGIFGNNVIITEAGWPGTLQSSPDSQTIYNNQCVNPCGYNYCSNTYQAKYDQDLVNQAISCKIPLMLFEGFVEPYKNTFQDLVDAQLGLCTLNNDGSFTCTSLQ